MPRNQPIKIRGAASTPAAVSVEDVQRAFYENASTPPTYWIAEMQLDPPQLIVCDDATSNLYRVPLTIKGSDITFGAAGARCSACSPTCAAPAKTAASRGPARDNEAIIAAAVSAGRIPASRASYWRTRRVERRRPGRPRHHGRGARYRPAGRQRRPGRGGRARTASCSAARRAVAHGLSARPSRPTTPFTSHCPNAGPRARSGWIRGGVPDPRSGPRRV